MILFFVNYSTVDLRYNTGKIDIKKMIEAGQGAR